MEKGHFRCYIHKFPKPLDLSDIQHIHTQLRYRCLALHFRDGTLSILNIGHGTKRDDQPPTLPSITAFQWLSPKKQTSIKDQGIARFVALTDNGEILTGQLCGDLLTTGVKQHVADIENIIENGISAEDCKDVKLLHGGGEYIVLSTQCHVVVVSPKEDGVQTVSVITLPPTHGQQCVQVVGSVVVLLHQEENTLLLYAIESGSLFIKVNLQRTNLESDRLLRWHVSEDLQSLVVIENTLCLSVIDLERYTQDNPACVETVPTPTGGTPTPTEDTPTSVTGLVGDVAWRERLHALHNRYSDIKNNPWYHVRRVAAASSRHSNKKQWRVSGFRMKTDVDVQKANVFLIGKVFLPPALQNMAISDLTITKCVVSLVFHSDQENYLCVCDTKTSAVATERLCSQSRVMLSRDPNFPHLVAMPTHLMCVVMDRGVQQEDFVSKMMVYAGASVADTLCHINKWGRCSIPIHTLEIGLKQRQLDTVVFFLKSKENFFSSSKLSSVASPTSPGVTSPSWSVTSSHHDNLTQLEPALQLLIETVEKNIGNQEAEGFAKKLSEILLDFLYGLLHDALNLSDSAKASFGHEDEVTDLNKAIEKLLDLIGMVRNGVRQILAKMSDGRMGSGERVPSVGTPVSEWCGMSEQAVIESGVMRNQIPILQSYLYDSGHQADLSTIHKASLNKAVCYLAARQIKPAILILANLGLDIDEKLWEITLMSVDKSTRDFIVSEMKARSPLRPEQADLVTFSDMLAQHYPCQSFQRACTQLQGRALRSPHRDTSMQPNDKMYDLSAECGELANTTDAETDQSDHSADDTASQSGRYSHILLDWLQWWSLESQQLVILDTQIGSKAWIEEMRCRLDLVIDYLARYNKLDKLRALIDHAAESSDQTIVQEICNQGNKMTTHTFLQINQYCVQHRLFMNQSDFPSLLRQLRYVGGPLTLPHPLGAYPAHVLDRFHQDFTVYCVENNLPSLLWQYCFLHSVAPDTLSRVTEGSGDHRWLSFFVHLYTVAIIPQATVSLYEASLANAVLTWSLDSSVIPALIGQGEVLTALATLVYSPHTLQQVTPGSDTTHMFGGLGLDDLEKALLPYPKLHQSFFPTSTIDTPQNDVTVYQLLKDNAPFSPSRLFGWQSMNRLSGEDAMRQLPHFSMPEFVSRFAYMEKIRYTYFLRQGRPSFAFASFLAEELGTDHTNLSNKSILAACGTALWIGMKNFHNPQISCACVVFTEMLGQNSVLIRTYLQVGQEILLHLNSCLTGNIDRRKEQARHNETEIASWLCGCVLQQRKHAHCLLGKLEDAISTSLDKDEIPRTSFESGQKWTIAVLFCQMLHLPLTTHYLEQCAHGDRWLPFLWFSQTHQYPKDQLQSLLYRFRSVHLQQHLHYVIENAETKASATETTPVEGQGQTTTKGKDVRSSLYVRIGLQKEAATVEMSSSDEEDHHQLRPPADDSENGVKLVDVDSAPDDVFRVVFVTQSSKCQWKSLLQYSIVLRNPLFSELAACTKDASVLPCMCGWLVAMMDVKEHDKFLKNHGKLAGKWNMRHLNNIIDIYLQNSWVSTLAKGFHIFQPDSPVISFLKFSAEFCERRNFSLCKVLLEDFKESFHLYCHDITSEDRDTILGDTDWFQQLTYRILQHHFTRTPSMYDVLQLLKLLDSQSIVLIFSFEVPDFGRLARLVQMVVNVPIPSISFARLVSNNTSDFTEECWSILRTMVDRKLFRQAREFAREAGLAQDQVTMEEVKDEKSKLELSPLWHSAITRRRFWKQCADSFLKYKLSVELATSFFQCEAAAVDSYREKAYLYQLCVYHMEVHCHTDMINAIDKVYHTTSIYRIRAKMEQIQQDDEGDDFMEDIYEEDTDPSDPHDRKKELLNYGKIPHKGKTPKELTEQEITALDLLIQELLDSGQVIESCRLATDFNFYSQDLVIILTCIRLALGTCTVRENMDLTMVNLLAEATGHRRLSLLPSQSLGRIASKTSMITLASGASSAWEFLPIDQEKNVVTMEALIDHCHHGNQCCKQVLNCYVIATVLDKGYKDVVLEKEFIVLKELLQTSHPQRFWLASEFLGSSSLKNSEVAGFLCDSIVHAYKYTYSDEETVHSRGEKDLLFDPTEDGGVASQFVTLCPDPSLLGDRLLDVVTTMLGEQLVTTALLSVQTELLILSHACHTAACNMEGISHVLRTARVITASLDNTHNFSLMVRLLTGVGRFSEMTYIFDSLKMNEHFELVLKKGIEKENSLKIALLDYLKRYHPSDIDTYDMVAHNFLMHREIAQMLQARAQRGLHKYKDKPLDNTMEIKTDLQNIVQDFTEAAESYYKESCLRHAQSCLRYARLVALQLQYLAPVLNVLHLSPEGADRLIVSHPKFLEALIISETYGKKGSWPEALCHNVLLGGDFRYLQDFKSHIKLTTSLVSETVEKYQSDKNHSAQSLNNLRKFVENHCRDVKLKYRVAEEFGFRDLQTALEKGDSSSYVIDLLHMNTG